MFMVFPPTRAPGVTRVALLVGMLVAPLLKVVQAVRESARRQRPHGELPLPRASGRRLRRAWPWGSSGKGGAIKRAPRRRRPTRSLGIQSLEPRLALAATPSLVADINRIGVGALEWTYRDTARGAVLGSTLYFSAKDNAFGTRTLWKTDGTEAGTVCVKDSSSPGLVPGNPNNLTAGGSTLYFSAYDGTSGEELWKTDGTEAGTVRVKDINPGTSGSRPRNLTAVGSTLYFTADDGASGWELWKTDGTEAGTVRVSDIRPGTFDSYPEHLTAVGSTLYFTASNGTNGGLWKTDGTEAGTVLVKNTNMGTSGTQPLWSSPHDLTAVGSTLYFGAYDTWIGRGLWKTDGTVEGTIFLGSILVNQIAAIGSTIYVGGGEELWKTDGTEAGTVLVKKTNTGSAYDSGPVEFTPVGATMYFRTGAKDVGFALWKTDGTESGTVRVKDVNENSFRSELRDLTAVGPTLFFTADDGASGGELWKSDGTPAGTVQVRDINPGAAGSTPGYFHAVGSTLLFAANDGLTGVELWRSDGSSAGTVMVKDISRATSDAAPNRLTAVGSTLYFTATDGVSGEELWKTDGTEAGAVRVKDIKPGSSGSAPGNLTAVGATLYFTADDGVSRGALWKTDGTEAGTVIVDQRGASSSTAVGSTLFYANGGGLWKTDGTTAGTVLVTSRVWVSGPMRAVGSTLYFSADDGITDVELWKTDGTEAGTVRVKDIRPSYSLPGVGRSRGDASPKNLTAIGSTLYFNAYDGGAWGPQLWKSDGTEAGTVRLSRIENKDDYGPRNLTAVGSTLYFTAANSSFGDELWKTDGTEAGTVRVKDINRGSASSAPGDLAAAGSLLYFTASTERRQLWRTDGSDAGTIRIDGFDRGPRYPEPGKLMAAGSALFLVADDGMSGRELWKLDVPQGRPSAAPTQVVGKAGFQEMRLSWTAPADDGGAAITGYAVQFKKTRDTTWSVFSGPVSGTSALVRVTEDAAYVFRVAARNVCGLSDFSAPSAAVSTGGFQVHSYLEAMTATYGSVSGVSRVYSRCDVLEAPVTATAPDGFEVSSDNVSFGRTAPLPYRATYWSGTVFVRLASGAPAGTHAGSLTMASSQYSWSVEIPTSSVLPKPLAITGLTAQPKKYDGSTGAKVLGAAALVGAVGGDNVALAGTPVGEFADKNAGSGRPVAVLGLSLTGTAARNYALAPLTLAASILPATLVVRADDKTRIRGAAAPPLTATVSGFAGGETVASALTGAAALSTTATAASRVGAYKIKAAAGTLAARSGNYTLSFVNGLMKVVTPPAAPSIPRGTPGAGVVTLTWAAPMNQGGSAVTDYVVQYRPSTIAAWTTFNDAVSAATHVVVSGLDKGRTYVFRVAAKNAAGLGAASAVSSPVVLRA